MKFTFQIIILLFSILTSTNCCGQDKLFNSVWKDLHLLQKKTNFPIIVIGPINSYAITTVKTPTELNAIVWESYYTFYTDGKRNIITRYVETVVKKGNKKIYKSSPVEFINDTLYSWLNRYKSEIFSEEILPFIYADTAATIPIFKEGFLMHTFPFEFSIYYEKDKYRSIKFDEIAMEAKLFSEITESPTNLNYNYNSQTKIYSLYKLLDKILLKNSGKFLFK